LKYLLFFTFIACASQPSQYSVVEKPEHFVSPGGSIDAAFYIQEDSFMGTLALKPGAVVAKHSHDGSGEYLYFTKGQGELTIGDEVIKVKDNMAVFIPRGVEHSYVNTGKKEAFAIQVYSPRGPEKRFKKWKDEL
tara:strand:+ start:2809 stop:3213 length:405 start_codon:yes stop_codon:yes gene_type:complete